MRAYVYSKVGRLAKLSMRLLGKSMLVKTLPLVKAFYMIGTAFSDGTRILPKVLDQ